MVYASNTPRLLACPLLLIATVAGCDQLDSTTTPDLAGAYELQTVTCRGPLWRMFR